MSKPAIPVKIVRAVRQKPEVMLEMPFGASLQAG
jgi:hypothetical protein